MTNPRFQLPEFSSEPSEYLENFFLERAQSDQINYDLHLWKQHYTMTIFRQPHVRLTPKLEVACMLMEAALDHVASMKGKSHSESAGE